MTPFFNSADRILRLNLGAYKWRGTPWRANSCALGGGVSCHNLPMALYQESRFADLPMVQDTPATATFTNAMEIFLDARPEFQRLKTAGCGLLALLQPGDLIGMFVPINNVGKRIRKICVNHLGVVLPEHWFIHTLMKKNTDIDLINVPPWSQTLIAAWRPLEHA